MTLVHAELIELNQETPPREKDGGQRVKVQFNPESLKLTFANQLAQPPAGDQGSGNPGRQFVGAGTTKLALQLWFDVTAMRGEGAVDDVRRLTQKVLYFMTPQDSETDRNKQVPPGVRFQWGSFLFDGVVEGIEETLEFFSPEGKPLRASMSLTFSQQKILKTEFKGAGRAPGQKPLHAAQQDDSLPEMARRSGKGGDWQSIAAANGVEDPLRLAPGRLLDLDAAATGSPGVAAPPGFPLGVAGGVALFAAAAPLSAAGSRIGLNASLGGPAGGSVSIG